jgi:hypothetical protein
VLKGLGRTAGCALGVAFFVVACGGASGNDDLFGGSSGASSGSSSGSTSSGSTSSGSSSGGSGSTSSSGGPTDGGTIPDGAPDAKLDAPVPPVDATIGDPGIACGQNPDCTVGAQVCCRTSTINGVTYACTAAGACAAAIERMPIPCDDAQDCATLGQGGVCCATYKFDPVAQRTSVVSVACMPSPLCTTPNSAVIMCDKGAADPCPNGGSCKPSQQTFPGFYLCI